MLARHCPPAFLDTIKQLYSTSVLKPEQVKFLVFPSPCTGVSNQCQLFGIYNSFFTWDIPKTYPVRGYLRTGVANHCFKTHHYPLFAV